MTRVTPKRRKKPVGMNEPRRQRALALIEAGEFITQVADQIGVSRQTLYREKRRNKAFANAWEEAEAIGHQIQASLGEEEMDFRGRLGWLEPKFHEGRICGFIRKFSDALLLARMKALMPEKYGNKTKIDHSGETHHPGALIVPGVMVPKHWEEVAQQMKDLGPPPMPEENGQ
ncbi:MAG: helix-turn-helix domain-containing protein [Geminicoccaceae bacterium]